MSEETPAKKKKSKKGADGKSGAFVKVVMAVIITLVVVAGFGTLAYSMGWVHAMLGVKRAKASAELSLAEPVLHALPEIRTDLKSGTCRSPFLRAIVQVQLAPEDAPLLNKAHDQVMDAVLTHLREQDRQSMVGKEGSERLRFELVQVIENVMQPVKIHTVFFKELVVQ